MKYYGVVYDVGTRVLGTGPSSVEPFREDVARNDMRVIAEDLHANALRIEGEDLHRLAVTAKAAFEVGLTIFFSPWKMNVDLETSKVYIEEAAKFAQQLTDEGADVVFIANCEYSIFCDGVYPGTNIFERSAWAKTHFGERLPLTPEGQSVALKEAHEKLNADLRVLVQALRNSFSGPVTYSSASFEDSTGLFFILLGQTFTARIKTMMNT